MEETFDSKKIERHSKKYHWIDSVYIDAVTNDISS